MQWLHQLFKSLGMKVPRVSLPERPLCQRGNQSIRRLVLQDRVLGPQQITGGYVRKTREMHFVDLDRQAQRTRKPLPVEEPGLNFIDNRGVLGMQALHVQGSEAVDLVQPEQATPQVQQPGFHLVAMGIFDGTQYQNPKFHLLQQHQQPVYTAALARCLDKQLLTQLLVLFACFQNPPDTTAVMPRVLIEVRGNDEVREKAEQSVRLRLLP
ncbi:hypothetical protein D3C76_1136560 [compost metagenome]